MSRRTAAVSVLVLGAFLAGCAGRTVTAPQPSGSIPVSAPVPAAGQKGPIPLTAAQQADLDKTVAAEPPAIRARLRYALASDGPGQSLVVYEQPAGAAEAKHGKTNVYAVYKILNRTDGATYDPEQNAVVAPIATPQPTPTPSG